MQEKEHRVLDPKKVDQLHQPNHEPLLEHLVTEEQASLKLKAHH